MGEKAGTRQTAGKEETDREMCLGSMSALFETERRLLHEGSDDTVDYTGDPAGKFHCRDRALVHDK